MRDSMGTVAQIMLCVLFLSFAALLLSAFGDPAGVIGNTVIGALSEVAPLRAWIELLYDAKDLYRADPSLTHAVSGSVSLALEGIVGVVLSSLMDSMIIGICIHLANSIAARMGGLRGGAVLSTVLGALTGCVLCGAAGLFSRDDVIEAATYILEIVLILVGIAVMLRIRLPRANGGFFRRFLWPIILGALASSVLTLYTSVLTLVIRRELEPALPWVTGTGIVTILLMIVFHWLEALCLKQSPWQLL